MMPLSARIWNRGRRGNGGVLLKHRLKLPCAGLLEQEARFIQQFEAGLYKGLLWEITAELEIRDRPTLSEGALDILLDSDPVKLGRTVERLHFLVHTFIPNKLNK